MIKYSEQFKISVIEHYETGIAGYRIVGQHFGLAPAIVRRWVLWHRTHGLAVKLQEVIRTGSEPRHWCVSSNALVWSMPVVMMIPFPQHVSALV